MNPMWPLCVSFMVFLMGAVVLTGLSVYLGYFAVQPQNVLLLGVSAFISAIIACSIGNQIATGNQKK